MITELYAVKLKNFHLNLKQRYIRPLVGYDFVVDVFLKAYCLANILQHVSPLAIGELPSNSLLHFLPLKNV